MAEPVKSGKKSLRQMLDEIEEEPIVFTPDEVASLNAYQNSNAFHPFTCGGNRTDAKHLDGEGRLVATEYGWTCPYCEYKQNWAHDFMKNWEWKKSDPSHIIQSISTIKDVWTGWENNAESKENSTKKTETHS